MQTAWNKFTGIQAKRLAETKDLKESEWQEMRSLGIGGSDIASVAGVNPFSSNIDVYLQKTGQYKVKENEKMKWGKILEQPVAQHYQDQHPDVKVQNVNAILQHPTIPFALANVDRLIQKQTESKDERFKDQKGNGILEVKTTGWIHAYEDGIIPDGHYCQNQWYLGVTGLRWGDFAVLKTGNTYEEHGIIKFDPVVFQNLVKIADDFWNNHVKKNIPPIPNAAPRSDFSKILYPSIKKNTIILNEKYDDICARRGRLKTAINEAQAQIKIIDAQLKYEMKDSYTGLTDSYKTLLIDVKKKSFQEKMFKEKHPELFKEFSKDTEYRYVRVNNRR